MLTYFKKQIDTPPMPQQKETTKAHTRSNHIFYAFCFFNLVLFAFNVLFIGILVRASRATNHTCRSCNQHQTAEYKPIKSINYKPSRKAEVKDENSISLDFRILDIYRIEVSCDIVDSLNRSGLIQRSVSSVNNNRTRRLYETARVGSLGFGFKRMRKHKGCPRAELITEFISDPKAVSKVNRKYVYEPFWKNETDFDPFKPSTFSLKDLWRKRTKNGENRTKKKIKIRENRKKMKIINLIQLKCF
jgi:hypothetical protein